MTNEIWPADTWKPVPGYPDYLISARGEVRSKRFNNRLLRHAFRDPDRAQVTLCVDGNRTTFRISTLVALAFHGPRPQGQVVRHLNDDPKDNRPENLAYGTVADNAQDLLRNHGHYMANRTHCQRGHEFTYSNTAYKTTGARLCKTCQQARQRRYNANRPARIKG